MKKKQEVELLEDQLRQMSEQKAAIESANEELKRQNKYWEDLFARQQLSQIPSMDPMGSNISNQSNKATEDTNNLELSYESLDLTRGDVMKRSKRADSENDFAILEQRFSQQDA